MSKPEPYIDTDGLLTIDIEHWSSMPDKYFPFTGKILLGNVNEVHYLKKGKRHREDGPAILWPNKEVTYYLDGEYYSKEEWFLKLPEEQQEKLLWKLDEI